MPPVRFPRAGLALALVTMARRVASRALAVVTASLSALGCGNEQPTETRPLDRAEITTALSMVGCEGCRRDNFTDPDGTLLDNHVSDGDGAPFTWIREDGWLETAVVQNNAVGKTSSGFWRYITNALEADSIEIEVEVLGDIASVSQQYDIGVVLRSTGPGTGYTVFWSAFGDGAGSADAFITVDRPDGNILYEEDAPVPTVGTHTLGVAVLETGAINVYVDGVLTAMVVDPAPLPPGNAGLNFGWTGSSPGLVWITTFAEGLAALATPLNVGCAPVLVTRGANVTCTASAADPTAQLTVNEWRFDGAELSAPIIESSSAPTWSGVAATSGTVRVKGTLGGAPAAGEAALNVAARDWTQDTVAYELMEITPSGLDPHPSVPGQLGNHTAEAEGYLPPEGFPQISSGPNQGVLFFTKVPVFARSRIRINRVALALNSDFYFHQPVTVPPFSNQCTRDDSRSISAQGREARGSHPGT